jgi:transposase InsO family protein
MGLSKIQIAQRLGRHRSTIYREVQRNRRSIGYLPGIAHQIVEAFPFDTAPRYLMRDRDSIYGKRFRTRAQSLHIEEVISAPRSPWQNPYVERIIGSIRRECLDHVIIFNERHLRQVLKSYAGYYHEARTHLSLDKQSPVPRSIQLPDQGNIFTIPHVGGLHHEYRRAA